MARIRSITETPAGTRVHPTEVDCEVARVIAEDGQTLLQLSTFGSDQRQSKPKTSQTFQIDRERALELRELIDRYFA
ncbi:hypothetical protein [Gordonia iterans]